MKRFKSSIPPIVGSCLLMFALNSQAKGSPSLRGMRLLDGYTQETLQGYESAVYKLAKKEGLEIECEVARVSAPGQPALGGDFSDMTTRIAKDHLRWYREQVVNGQPVHLAYTKDSLLVVTFPQLGATFKVKISTADEMADALLMILTYAEDAKKPPVETGKVSQ